MHDCVYYWIGGTERGKWRDAFPSSPNLDNLRIMLADLRRMGYVACLGSREAGPPEAPPTKQDGGLG